MHIIICRINYKSRVSSQCILNNQLHLELLQTCNDNIIQIVKSSWQILLVLLSSIVWKVDTRTTHSCSIRLELCLITLMQFICQWLTAPTVTCVACVRCLCKCHAWLHVDVDYLPCLACFGIAVPIDHPCCAIAHSLTSPCTNCCGGLITAK